MPSAGIYRVVRLVLAVFLATLLGGAYSAPASFLPSGAGIEHGPQNGLKANSDARYPHTVGNIQGRATTVEVIFGGDKTSTAKSTRKSTTPSSSCVPVTPTGTAASSTHSSSQTAEETSIVTLDVTEFTTVTKKHGAQDTSFKPTTIVRDTLLFGRDRNVMTQVTRTIVATENVEVAPTVFTVLPSEVASTPTVTVTRLVTATPGVTTITKIATPKYTKPKSKPHTPTLVATTVTQILISTLGQGRVAVLTTSTSTSTSTSTKSPVHPSFGPGGHPPKQEENAHVVARGVDASNWHAPPDTWIPPPDEDDNSPPVLPRAEASKNWHAPPDTWIPPPDEGDSSPPAKRAVNWHAPPDNWLSADDYDSGGEKRTLEKRAHINTNPETTPCPILVSTGQIESLEGCKIYQAAMAEWHAKHKDSENALPIPVDPAVTKPLPKHTDERPAGLNPERAPCETLVRVGLIESLEGCRIYQAEMRRWHAEHKDSENALPIPVDPAVTVPLPGSAGGD